LQFYSIFKEPLSINKAFKAYFSGRTNYSQRLVSVSEGGITLGQYTYDAIGTRIKKVAGGTTTLYVYDQNGLLIEECSSEGIWGKDYVYLNGQPLAMIVAGTTENVYYYHNDHLGTPQMMIDSTGAVVWAATYEPFGKATINIQQITNNLRFPGQYYDQETGLHYNWFRYYDPETGRYVGADPIGLDGGINLYTYVVDDPVNWIDPYGLQAAGGRCEQANKTCIGVARFSAIGPRQALAGALVTFGVNPNTGTVAINPAIFGFLFQKGRI
jgi:Rhs family protein